MNLTEMIVEMRLEIQELAESVFLDTELTRGVQKCVSLMSRFIPKRDVLETTLGGTISSETITISSDTGTTEFHPIKPGSFSITDEKLDTDYTINYLTGVVTEIGSLLANDDYTCKYELDPLILDISTLLPEEDYIKIENVEYPVGDSPPTYIHPEVFGELIRIKSVGSNLTDNKHLRIIYQKPWAAPTASVAATLTTTLGGTNDDLVFTARVAGTVGNATTITYTDPGSTHTLSVAVSNADIVVTLGYNGSVVNSTAADIEALIEADADAVGLVSVANASSNDGTGLVAAMGKTALTGGSDTGVDGDYPEHLDNAVIIGAVGQTLIFKAEKYVQSAADALSSLDAPGLETFSLPTLSSLPALPAYPTTPIKPSPDYSATAIDLLAVGTDIALARAEHTEGKKYMLIPTGGADPTGNYGKYADGLFRAAGIRVNAGMANLTRQGQSISLFATEVAAYGSKVSEYANLMSGTIGKYREDVAGQSSSVAASNAIIAKFVAQTAEQEMKARNFLEIAGRYLASGQAKINEFLISLGIKPELSTSRSSSEQRA